MLRLFFKKCVLVVDFICNSLKEGMVFYVEVRFWILFFDMDLW